MSSLGDPFPTDDVWKAMPWYERYLWEINHRDGNHYGAQGAQDFRGHFFDAIRAGDKPDWIVSSSYNTDSGWDNNVPHRGPAGLSEGQLIEILKRIKPRVMNEDIMLKRRPYLLTKGERLRRLQPQKTMPQYMIDDRPQGFQAMSEPEPENSEMPIDLGDLPPEAFSKILKVMNPKEKQNIALTNKALAKRLRINKLYHQNMADRIRAEQAAGIFRYNRREPWRIDDQGRMLEPPESYFQRGNCRNEPGLRRSMGGGSKRRTKRNKRSKNKRSKRKSRSKRRLCV